MVINGDRDHTKFLLFWTSFCTRWRFVGVKIWRGPGFRCCTSIFWNTSCFITLTDKITHGRILDNFFRRRASPGNIFNILYAFEITYIQGGATEVVPMKKPRWRQVRMHHSITRVSNQYYGTLANAPLREEKKNEIKFADKIFFFNCFKKTIILENNNSKSC